MNAIEQHLLLSLKRLSFFRLSRHLLVLCLLSLAPAILSAATIDDLEFTLINNDTEYSVSAKDPRTIAGELNIPATYNGKPVTAIEDSGFSSNRISWTEPDLPDITSVTIPSSIKTIGIYAFYNCPSLTAVHFAPNSQVSVISSATFSRCSSLIDIILPNSLTRTYTSAFEATAITSIDFSQTALKRLGNWTFHSCEALTSDIFPDTLTKIEYDVFIYCNRLISATFMGPSPIFSYSGGRDAFFKPFQRRDDDNEMYISPDMVITIYKEHEASYASWNDAYNFNVIGGPAPDLVLPALQTSYNPTSKALNVITKVEGSTVNLALQHTDSLGETWATVDPYDYLKFPDTDTDTIVRSITLDPATQPRGFYRLISE